MPHKMEPAASVAISEGTPTPTTSPELMRPTARPATSAPTIDRGIGTPKVDQLTLGDLVASVGKVAHLAAVLQYGDLVAEIDHLLQEVTDEDDRHAGIGQLPDQRPEALLFLGRQRCRGLVEDQMPPVHFGGWRTSSAVSPASIPRKR